MAAPVGNQFWKARSSHGRKPIFESPEKLLEACEEYFEWVESNPLWEDKLVTFQGSATHEPVAKMRAMTIGGLCIFLDISQQAWSEYRHRKGFGEVTTQVEQTIREQKFSGAAADLLNANIIARDLGLADKQEFTGKDGGPIAVEYDDKEAARRIAFALAKGAQN
jgi:hypothetical protein